MNVSIDELVAVVDVKLASLVGAVEGAGGCCRCRPAGGALYLAEVVKTSLTVGGVGFGLWSWADGEGLVWCCSGGGLAGTGEKGMPGCGWAKDVACETVGGALAVGIDGWSAPPCSSSSTVGRP